MGKFALIIGNSRYDDPNLSRLKAPDLDVRGLEEVLKAPDIGQFDEVVTLLNESCASARKEVARFYERRQRDDLLLLYFSGHGVKDDQGHLYLALRDTESALLAGSAIETAFITARMDRSFSKRQVLVLDCCHSGAFAGGAKAAHGVSVGTAEAFEGTGLGRVILAATDATQYAWEGDRVIGDAQTSLFTHFVIDGLRTGAADSDDDGLVTVDELYEYVREQVLDATPRQTPRKWSYRQQGDIVLAQNPSARQWVLPPDITEAKNSRLPSLRLVAVRDLAKLLRAHKSERSRVARAALKELSLDDSRKVANAAIQVLKEYEDGRAADLDSHIGDAASPGRARTDPAAPLPAVRPTADHDRSDLPSADTQLGAGDRGARRRGESPSTLETRLEVLPSDIFISYEHHDRDRARALANALGAQGWTVWWDRRIAPGEAFDLVIERELASCKCVIVLWSARSVGATWVRNEARRAARRKVLVPVLIEPVEPPLEFENLQAADLATWQAEAQHPEFEAVLERIHALAPSRNHIARVAVKKARRDFAAGRTREALTSLEGFRPMNVLVSQALRELRADAERIDGGRNRVVDSPATAATVSVQAASRAGQTQAAVAATAVETASTAEAVGWDQLATARPSSSESTLKVFTEPGSLRHAREGISQGRSSAADAAIKARLPGLSLLRSRSVLIAIAALLALGVLAWILGYRAGLAPGSTGEPVQQIQRDEASSSERAPSSVAGRGTGTQASVASPPNATIPATSPVLPSSRIESFPPARPAAHATSPRANEPAEGARAKPASASNVEELRTRARLERQSGEHERALITVTEGLRKFSKDPVLTSMLSLLLGDAESAAARSKDEATRLDAKSRAEELFTHGLQREAEAGRLRRTGRIDAAIRAWWAAADQFTTAAAQSRQAADAEAAEEARINSKAKAGADGQTRQTPSAQPTADRALPDSAVEQRLIQGTLRRYESAYASLNAEAVRGVFPGGPIDQLARDFAGYQSYTLTIRVESYGFLFNEALWIATVPAVVLHDIRPKSGQAARFEQPQTFQLVKQGDAWIIRQVR